MKRILSLLQLIEDTLLVLLLTLMVLLSGSQILLRNLFDSGIIWADPALRILVLWIALLGAMVATRNHRHISIDILSHYLSDTYKKTIHRITDGFAAIISLLVGWHAGRFVLFEMEDPSLLFLNIPAWVCEAIIPIGFTVIGLRFLFYTLAGRQSEEPSP